MSKNVKSTLIIRPDGSPGIRLDLSMSMARLLFAFSNVGKAYLAEFIDAVAREPVLSRLHGSPFNKVAVPPSTEALDVIALKHELFDAFYHDLTLDEPPAVVHGQASEATSIQDAPACPVCGKTEFMVQEPRADGTVRWLCKNFKDHS